MPARNLVFLLLLTFVFCGVTVREISGVTSSNQLLYAGNLPVSASSNSSLYFLFYGVQGVTDRSKLASTTTLVVLGSPSGSSQYLNFAGMGPLTLASNMSLVNNSNTPSAYANLMFVDFLGVGFSFADEKELPDNYAVLAQQLSYGLKQFTTVDIGQGKLVLVGESSWIRTVPFYGLDNIKGFVTLSPWPELYTLVKYYGVAGVDFKLFSESEKRSIEATVLTCSNNLHDGKYREAHNCYDSVLNFIENNVKNRNLYNVNLNQSLIQAFSLIQYYLTIPATVTRYLAPTSRFFEQQTNVLQSLTYTDQAKNCTQNISYFMRDNLDSKFLYLSGTEDFISYNKAVLNWTTNELNFVESAQYAKLNLTDVNINGTVVARTKSVTQVTYAEIIGAGHYLWQDKPEVVNALLQQWVGKIKTKEETGHLRQQEEIVI